MYIELSYLMGNLGFVEPPAPADSSLADRVGRTSRLTSDYATSMVLDEGGPQGAVVTTSCSGEVGLIVIDGRNCCHVRHVPLICTNLT